MSLIFKHRNVDGSLDTTTTMKATAIILSYALIGGFIGAAIAALAIKAFGGPTLQPTTAWLEGYEKCLWFVGSMLGIAQGGTVGKRATAKAAVIDAEARARSGVSATPDSDPPSNGLPRISTSAMTIGESVGAQFPIADRALPDDRVTAVPPELRDATRTPVDEIP